MTNDAKMPELLPCPFCGGPAEWQIGEYGDGHPMRYIACRDCEAMAPAVGRQEWAENAAIAAWNRRTDLCASWQQVRALMEALRELTKQGRKTWNLGAQTGSHWVHLGAAVSKAERLLAALTPAPQPEVVPMDRALVEENARLHAAMLVFGAYLLEKGETFRTGEGAELVDAYSAALTPAPDAPQPEADDVADAKASLAEFQRVGGKPLSQIAAEMDAPQPAGEAVLVSQDALIDLIGEFGREVCYMLDDCETSGPVGEEVHTITDESLTKVSAILDRIDALPFEEPGVILGTGAMLQAAIKQTFQTHPPQPSETVAEAIAALEALPRSTYDCGIKWVRLEDAIAALRALKGEE